MTAIVMIIHCHWRVHRQPRPGRCRRGRRPIDAVGGDFMLNTKLQVLSARAGLVMDPRAPVTYNGVQIDRVGSILADSTGRDVGSQARVERKSQIHQPDSGQCGSCPAITGSTYHTASVHRSLYG
jgi:hypothetical protein